MRTLNLGILAHVDAGKTSLTEQLLFAAGVIDVVGSVDAGSTQTDSLALERRRGITIKSAVVSFTIGETIVNLIDTPGHPDFIAEVERALSVLDGAVLVISAVEGVQAQTRVLWRALRRLGIPTVLFVNKVDRAGADPDRVLAAIAPKLSAELAPLSLVSNPGTAAAKVRAADPVGWLDVLSRHDDRLLASYVIDETAVTAADLAASVARLSRQGAVFPVACGSAITGVGVQQLLDALPRLLPAVTRDPDGPVAGSVFKVERGVAGQRVALARLTSGTIRVRDRVVVAGREQKVTGIAVYDNGCAAPQAQVVAGRIARLTGMPDVRIGDAIGDGDRADQHWFAPPTLETVVVARDPRRNGALHLALTQLAEQDPLIDLRQDDVRGELFLSLYGEVQKEVIQTTLAEEYGVEVEFRETTTICIERPTGSGDAVELLYQNPFLAGLGLRVEPGPIGSGGEFAMDVPVEAMPLYVYKSADEFRRAMTETVRDVLRQGLAGWQVVDCRVTMTHCDYSSPGTSSRDFRLLTPLVLMEALRQAGTAVCEPIHRFRLEVPADTVPAVMPVLSRLDTVRRTQETAGENWVLAGEIPAARVHELQQRLGGLTRGEGVAEFAFDHHAPVHRRPPTRARTDRNPLNRKEYLLHLSGRVQSGPM